MKAFVSVKFGVDENTVQEIYEFESRKKAVSFIDDAESQGGEFEYIISNVPIEEDESFDECSE